MSVLRVLSGSPLLPPPSRSCSYPVPSAILFSLVISRGVVRSDASTASSSVLSCAHTHARILKNSEDGVAVAAHRARLPLSFFHRIPSPPCHQPSRPTQPKTTAEIAVATSNNASERPELKPPILPEEGGSRSGGDSWPPSPGTSAAGLYQGDNLHADGSTSWEMTGSFGQGEDAGGKGTKRAEDEGRGAGIDSGNVCIWRRCRVKGPAATEERHTGDVVVVVEWDDEVGGQVRREDSGDFGGVCYPSALLVKALASCCRRCQIHRVGVSYCGCYNTFIMLTACRKSYPRL